MYAAGDEAYITNVMVGEEHRCQGVGRMLVRALIGRAAGLGVTSLTLEVRTGNAAAIALYSSLGFTRRGVRRGMYDKPAEDGIVMGMEMHN